jgi:hypothetical protein
MTYETYGFHIPTAFESREPKKALRTFRMGYLAFCSFTADGIAQFMHSFLSASIKGIFFCFSFSLFL